MQFWFADYRLDTHRRELRRGPELISVGPQVFDLLVYVVSNREHVVSKDDLIEAVWGGRTVSESTLASQISAMRKAVGDSGEEQRLIRTVSRKGYRFIGEVKEVSASTPHLVQSVLSSSAHATLRARALALPDRPSIAVLPFTNLNGDPAEEYLADGVVEDIITELSRFSELFVVARNSSFQYKGKATDIRQVGRELGVRYVLEGSVRRGEDRLRISAQLIDAMTGGHRWAERYDRKLEGVFALPDEVACTIATILVAHLRKAESERARANPPNSWQAYDYYLQAADAFAAFTSSFNMEDLHETRRLVQKSLSVDAKYSRSYAVLAAANGAAWVNASDSDFLNPGILEEAHQLARKAVQLDPNLPQAHASLGYVLMWRHQYDESVTSFERAIALNANYVDWPFGAALIFAGESRRAIDVLKGYMRLDPFYVPMGSGLLGWAHYMLKQYAEALPMLRDCASRMPQFRSGHVWLAATYAQIGQVEEARAEAAEILRITPEWTIATSTRLVGFKDPEDRKHYVDGLRKAGLPGK